MTRPTIIAGVLALAAAIAPASSATVAEAQHAQAACGQTTVAGIKWKVTALGLPCSQGRTIALAFGQAHGPLLKKLGTTAAQTSSGRLRLSGMPSGTDWACYVSYPATRRPPGFFLCRDLKSIASNGGRTFDTVTFARVAVSTPPTTGGTSATR